MAVKLIEEKEIVPLEDNEKQPRRGERFWNKHWGIALTDEGKKFFSESLTKAKKEMKQVSLPAAASKKLENKISDSPAVEWIIDWARSASPVAVEGMKVSDLCQ